MSDLNKFLKDIESCYGLIKTGDSEKGISELSECLSKAIDKHVSVRVVPVNRSKQFFAMCIIPEDSVLNKITSAIVKGDTNLEIISSLWKKCKNWNLEIDGKVISSRFTERELTAMTLHEIGHIIQTNSIPVRINNIIQFELAKANVKDKSIVGSKLYNTLLKIPIVQACTMGNINSIKKELKADKFAVKYGYLTDMISVMGKIQELGGANLSSDNSISKATGVSINTVNSIRTRQANLARQNLSILRERLPENYMKEAVNEFMNDVLTRKDSEIYESTDNIMDLKYYTEFLNIGKKKMDGVTQAQLDYIEANIFDIKTNDDKLMLLSYTNSKLELCNYYLEILYNPEIAKKYIVPNGKNQLLRFRLQLNNLREKIINYKIPKKDDFVVFYPDGYEG